MAGSPSDMDRLGETVVRACRQTDSAFRRVNLEIPLREAIGVALDQPAGTTS